MLRFEYRHLVDSGVSCHETLENLIEQMNALGAQGFQYRPPALDGVLIFERVVDPDEQQRAGEHGGTHAEPPRMVEYTCGDGCREIVSLSEAASETAHTRGLVPYLPGHGPDKSSTEAYLAAPTKMKR